MSNVVEMVTIETVPQVAKRWGVTRGRIHQMIQAGHFGEVAVRMGRDWIIVGHPPRFAFMVAEREKEVA